MKTILQKLWVLLAARIYGLKSTLPKRALARYDEVAPLGTSCKEATAIGWNEINCVILVVALVLAAYWSSVMCNAHGEGS